MAKMIRVLTATLPNGETFRKEIRISNSMSCDFDFATAYRSTAAQLREDLRQYALGLDRDAAYRFAQAEKETDPAKVDTLLLQAADSEKRAAEKRAAIATTVEDGPWMVDNFTRYAETVSPAAVQLRRRGYDVAVLRFQNVIETR